MLTAIKIKNTAKFFNRRTCVAAFLCVVTSNSYAIAIGSPEPAVIPDVVIKPEITKKPQTQTQSSRVPGFKPVTSSDTQLGFGTMVSRVSASDDVGKTRSESSAQALSIYFTNFFIKDMRYLSELHLSNYAFEADENHIGQEVHQLGFRFSVQKKQKIVKHLSPWFGAGFDVFNSNYTKRHSVDSEGFLTESYDNERKAGVSVLLNIMEKWEINSDMDFAAKLEYSIPVVQAVSRVSIGFIIFFQPKL